MWHCNEWKTDDRRRDRRWKCAVNDRYYMLHSSLEFKCFGFLQGWLLAVSQFGFVSVRAVHRTSFEFWIGMWNRHRIRFLGYFREMLYNRLILYFLCFWVFLGGGCCVGSLGCSSTPTPHPTHPLLRKNTPVPLKRVNQAAAGSTDQIKSKSKNQN